MLTTERLKFQKVIIMSGHSPLVLLVGSVSLAIPFTKFNCRLVVNAMRVERIQPEFYSRSEVIRVKSDNANNDAVKNVHFKQKSVYVFEEIKQQITEDKLSRKELVKKVEQLNDAMDLFNRKLSFQVHEETQRIYVQILNSETGEVIKEIPPEKFLDMLENISEAIGIIVDEKA